jgi:hypothetical protein
MELFALFVIGIGLVVYFSNKNDDPIKTGIDRLNQDVAKQSAKLKNPFRNSL